jgi:hypothetical protein
VNRRHSVDRQAAAVEATVWKWKLLRPVPYKFGGNAKHDGMEDSLRHQMSKYVVSCAAQCLPPPW